MLSEHDKKINEAFLIFKNAKETANQYERATRLNKLEKILQEIPILGSLLWFCGAIGDPGILGDMKDAYRQIQSHWETTLIELVRNRPGIYPLKEVTCIQKSFSGIHADDFGFKYSFEFLLEGQSITPSYWSYLRWGVWVRESHDQNPYIEVGNTSIPVLSLIHLPEGYQIPVGPSRFTQSSKEERYCVWQPELRDQPRKITLDFDELEGRWGYSLSRARICTATKILEEF